MKIFSVNQHHPLQQANDKNAEVQKPASKVPFGKDTIRSANEDLYNLDLLNTSLSPRQQPIQNGTDEGCRGTDSGCYGTQSGCHGTDSGCYGTQNGC